ncbi:MULTISPECIES: bifunctional oligoribonuclease/PAP phosphatase NrnA [Haloferax]|uniref:Bifunctional oligoribonuclease/PAP phosphatase NrnA n=1 Tax=Haloferax marinum TaxID=2666143 RepID=A0A6A8G985_9EURY|nr:MULTISPECIES: bifunctional oligoribonuclease/PAP phosphatase NrnA [Haloferax]KAB1198072.1 bifunctional oligoribonuclease/PAP phosphatase NrnA [Haloferax sp. CBA1150]MRW97142.1 bifunctional oligoribonuclease/PAP phosphatase NrnA [Haloferax marinum]
MQQAQQLRKLLVEGDELDIVCHNNPDPDCLASALALGRIAMTAGIEEPRILYNGDISHQQNRAFVNLLDIDLQQFDPAMIRDRPPSSLLAFVDHSVPGANNRVPEGTPLDIVIDHHPVNGIDARFVDHREHLGAAATIFTEYLRELDIELDEALATALLFAIRRETLNFLRGATREEYEAAGYLHGAVDADLLRRLSAPPVTGVTLDAIATAIDNRIVKRSVLISNVGRTIERDALPQAADYLATLEGVETAIVFGIIRDAIHLSARSPDPRIHAGNILRETFEDVGSCGGHHDVAGGEVPLGIFADYTSDDEQLLAIVEEVVTDRLFAKLNLATDSKS